MFDAIGVTAAIEQAGFVRSTGNTVWWGSPAPRIETFADGARGWQVELGALEAVLLDSAASAGVTVDRAVLGDEIPRAAFVLDCSGRSGVLARARRLRRRDDGPRTIAIAGEWRSDRWDLPDPSHTVIESYGDGWMWSVPVAGGARHVSAMVDPQRSDLARGRPSSDVYRSEIAKTRAFARLLAHASLESAPSGWDASSYHAAEYAGDGWLLVGDAASFIDPLSSAGVKKALASAWLAAVTVHTCLTTPSMRDHALRFYGDREREIEQHHRDESAAFLSSAARQHDRPFWSERAADPQPPRDDAVVRDAFERLKAAASVRLTVSPAIRIAPAPLVEGRLIVLAPHVFPPDAPAIRYLYSIDLVRLLELAPGVSQVPELFEAYSRHAPPPPLPDFLLALSTAVARGWLVAQ